jgi:hypothetical protein
VYNVEGKIGGDSALSPRGQEYAKALPDLILKNIGNTPMTVCKLGGGSMASSNHSAFIIGVDFYITKNDTDRRTPSLPEAHLEVAR